MPVNKDTTKRFAINLPVELAEKVDALAAGERRSVASWLRNAVEDAVKASSDASLNQAIANIPGATVDVVTKNSKSRSRKKATA